jgi:hypothetical protein
MTISSFQRILQNMKKILSYFITYFVPVPNKYVLVPCNVIGPGLHPRILIIRLDNFDTAGIIAAIFQYTI